MHLALESTDGYSLAIDVDFVRRASLRYTESMNVGRFDVKSELIYVLNTQSRKPSKLRSSDIGVQF